ncbi:hypothetical protein LSTR_LSTR017163 [Laodelphax striatellus]|uniref:C2H2-type domain-containing protein n=1 Tax=Laodelphax striatellus TaxID=195883 RepID=A0A482XL41_LAOST|nr:hypothetical protein LSTR_LSTR017163 [Laodelphax striatellus]
MCNLFQMDEEILVCPICTKTFELPTTYHTHLRLSHRISKRGEKLPPLKKGENKSDVKVKKEKPTNYPCPQCKWVFTTEPNLKRHMKNLHPSDNEERLKCGYCEFETTVLYYLKRHIQRHTEEENKTKYKCQYCELKFDDLARLKNHETNKHKNGNKKKINYCKKCPKCSFVSTKKTRDEIVAHFKNAHNIDFAWQSFTFDSSIRY